MNRSIGFCVLLGATILCSSCEYGPPKNEPTVSMNIKADSLSVLLKVCQNSRWASTGTVANSAERPIERKTLFNHPVNEYDVLLPAGQDVKLDFVGFGGMISFNHELFCDNTVQLHTKLNVAYRADMYDVDRKFCQVRISEVHGDGSTSMVPDVIKIKKDVCSSPIFP